MSQLNYRETKALRLHQEGKSWNDIGRIMEISKTHARNLVTSAKEKIQSAEKK